MKETVVAFKKDTHANGINVSRMSMVGFKAEREVLWKRTGNKGAS